MATLTGLPDFGRPLAAADALAFAPFGDGACGVVPDTLALATTADGTPRFQLELLRRADDLSADGQSAVLDIQLVGHYPLEAALAAARADGDATARALPIDLGFIRLVPAGSALGLDAITTAPSPLGWSAADGARWTQRLSPAAGALIRNMLKSGNFPFGARLEFTIRGVAPRAPARLRFSPATLLTAVLAGKAQPVLALEDLHAFLATPLATALLRIDGTVPPGALPQMLLDRLLGAYGTLAPAAGAADPTTARFISPPPGDVLWDLSQPVVVSRAFLLQLDLAAALDGPNLAALVRETVVPPLDLGFRDIAIAANLPAHRSGVPAIGVRLDLPPRPPARPSAISETLTLVEPDDAGRVSLRVAPDEPLSYRLTPFALLVAGRDVRQIEGDPVAHDETWLDLQSTDFPIAFARVAASAPLLAIATVSGVLAIPGGATTLNIPIALDARHPDIAVAMPKGAQGTISLTVHALDGSAAIDLPALPADAIALDLPSLPGYGPHRVAISADLAAGDGRLAIELAGRDGGNPATVTLVPQSPSAEWGYVAASPFRSGFRWRLAGGAWSDADGALLALTRAGRDKSAPPPPIPPEIDGVRLYPDPDQPGTIRYVPAAPSAASDGGGHPAVSLLRTGQAVFVQVGAQFTLPDDELARLSSQLAVPAAALQPAPVSVERVGLLLAGQTGAEREIASSTSSGYPPFGAALSASLSAEDGARAIGAVNGAPGQLFVDYTLGLPGAAAPLVARADISSWFPAGTGANHIQIAN